MSCDAKIQEAYLVHVSERNHQERSQFKEVIRDYMEILRQMRKLQDHNKQLERETYSLKKSKGYSFAPLIPY